MATSTYRNKGNATGKKLYLTNSTLILNLLTTTIVAPPSNASKWQTGFNSAFKGLTLNLLTTTLVAPPSNASKWQTGFNSAFKGLTLNLLTTTIVAPPSNASKWQTGFNSAFKGLKAPCLRQYYGQERQCSYNVALRHVRATTVEVENQ